MKPIYTQRETVCALTIEINIIVLKIYIILIKFQNVWLKISGSVVNIDYYLWLNRNILKNPKLYKWFKEIFLE